MLVSYALVYLLEGTEPSCLILASVPDPKPTLARIAFSNVILEVIYVPDEVGGETSHIPVS